MLRNGVAACLLVGGSICQGATFTVEGQAIDIAPETAKRAVQKKSIADKDRPTGAGAAQTNEAHSLTIDDMHFHLDVQATTAVVTAGTKWPNGNVYYVFESSVTAANRGRFRDAANEWTKCADLRFIEGTGSGNHIRVQNSDRNSSWVGMQGTGAQALNVYSWSSKYVIAHEIGHALGLIHEHQRPDRDSFITINASNIDPFDCDSECASVNFDKQSGADTPTPYDFESIMHYSKAAFALPGTLTIQPKPAYSGYADVMGNRNYLSRLDCEGMAAIYGRPYTIEKVELLANGDFSDGENDWSFHGDMYADDRFINSRSPYAYAYLSNLDGSWGDSLSGEFSQWFDIPANAEDTEVSFWCYISTTDGVDFIYDKLTVDVYSDDGVTHKSMQLSNRNAGSGYVKYSMDVSEMAGGLAVVVFSGETDGLNPTVFRVDDVSVIASVPSGSTFLSFDGLRVHDGIGGGSGNADGRVNPGESIALDVRLYNSGNTTAENITAVLSTSSPHVTISDDDVSFDDIRDDDAEWCNGDFNFQVSSNYPDEREIPFTVDIESDQGNWTVHFSVPVIFADNTPPGVTINKATGQSDPTTGSVIAFTATFSEPVSGFSSNDITLGGTAGPTSVALSGSGPAYTVSVSGMTQSGTVTVAIPAGRVQDEFGNPNTASTSSDNSVQYDLPAPPSAQIAVAAGQANPTVTSPIHFTVVFNEPVTGFASGSGPTGDIALSGTAGATTWVVTGVGTTFNVAVSGMATSGTVAMQVRAGAAENAAFLLNTASAVSPSVTFTIPDTLPPTVAVNQASGQTDPTTSATVNFTVTFSEPVIGFASGDVTLGGSAGATTAIVTGSSPSYNVAVTGMTQSGTVTASVAAGKAQDAAGNPNSASTSSDNTVTYNRPDTTPPTVVINQASGQADPTAGPSITFTVTFSEPVSGFTNSDITIGGTAGATTAAISGGGPTYTIAISGMAASGTVTASIAAGRVQDGSGNLNSASASTDNTVQYDQPPPPTATISVASGQANPTTGSSIHFTVVFNEPVTGFSSGSGPTGDVALSGTAGATTWVVTGAGTTFNVAVSGMTQSGSVSIRVRAGAVENSARVLNTQSPVSTGVRYDVPGTLPPTATISLASGQANPTGASPVNFTVVFNEPVTGFASGSGPTGDVALSGTAGATTWVVTGAGTTFNVAVSGMTDSGTVVLQVRAGAAENSSFVLNTVSAASTAVQYNKPTPTAPAATISLATGQANPTGGSPIHFTVVFNEPVTGFASGSGPTGDIALSGTAGATTWVVTGVGTTFNVAVSGMTASGTVAIQVRAGAAENSALVLNTLSPVSTAVQYDAPIIAAPTATISVASSQANPTTSSPIHFTVVFNEPVTGFASGSGPSGDIAISGTAGATTWVVTGVGTTFDVAVSGMIQSGSVAIRVRAGAAENASRVLNTQSPVSTGVRYDVPGTLPPTATISLAPGQANPTAVSPVNFTVVFNEPVTGFASGSGSSGDVALSGTAGATTWVVTGVGTTFTVAVGGMTGSGTVAIQVRAGAAENANLVLNTASAVSPSVNFTVPDIQRPSVTLNQAAGQADPAPSGPVLFSAIFSEPVTGFATGDVTINGTAGATTAVVTGSGATYQVAVSGMVRSGTVQVSIAADKAQDGSGNTNTASTSTDRQVQFSPPPESITVASPAREMGEATPGGVHTLAFGQALSLAAKPRNGFRMDHWLVNGVVTASGQSSLQLAYSGQNRTVQPVFGVHDPSRPRVTVHSLSNDVCRVLVSGLSGSNTVLLGSTDLTNWSAVATIPSSPTPYHFLDEITRGEGPRFYRLGTPSAPVLPTSFLDEFNAPEINTNVWKTAGNTVTQPNGVMKVATTVTDAGGRLTGGAFRITDKEIQISRRVFLHYPNNRSMPSFALAYLDDGGVEQSIFSIRYGYMRYSAGEYASVEGLFLARGNANPHYDVDRPNCVQIGTVTWDAWFDEVITYHPVTGRFRYARNGVELMDSSCPTAQPGKDLFFMINAWGWFTGHAHEMDRLEVRPVTP